MARSRVLPISLLIFSVAPTTLIAFLLAIVGLPFWVAGLIDVLVGNISLHSLANSPRLNMVFLYVSAPLGVIGLISLWRVFLLMLCGRKIERPRRLIVGMCCGLFAGLHLLFLKVALLPLALPAAVYALFKLFSTPAQGATSHAA